MIKLKRKFCWIVLLWSSLILGYTDPLYAQASLSKDSLDDEESGAITVKIGSPAPEIRYSCWIKGTEIKSLPDKGIVVIDFGPPGVVPARTRNLISQTWLKSIKEKFPLLV